MGGSIYRRQDLKCRRYAEHEEWECSQPEEDKSLKMGERGGTGIYIRERWYHKVSNVVPKLDFEHKAALTVEDSKWRPLVRRAQSTSNRLLS